MEEFLGLPSRPPKPRDRGWTHVIDKGLTLAEVSGVLELAGEYIDIVKLGWGTSYVAGKLAEKLRLYRDAGIPVMTGGTLLEAAIARNRLDEFRQWTADHGFTHIEVSDGTIDLERGARSSSSPRWPRTTWCSPRSGRRTPSGSTPRTSGWPGSRRSSRPVRSRSSPRRASRGTSGIFRQTGEVRSGLIDEIVHEVPLNQLLFEAPQKEQQAWFIRHFGADVNLGNIAASDVIPLETLRLGLRADTMLDLLLRDLPHV